MSLASADFGYCPDEEFGREPEGEPEGPAPGDHVHVIGIFRRTGDEQLGPKPASVCGRVVAMGEKVKIQPLAKDGTEVGEPIDVPRRAVTREPWHKSAECAAQKTVFNKLRRAHDVTAANNGPDWPWTESEARAKNLDVVVLYPSSAQMPAAIEEAKEYKKATKKASREAAPAAEGATVPGTTVPAPDLIPAKPKPDSRSAATDDDGESFFKFPNPGGVEIKVPCVTEDEFLARVNSMSTDVLDNNLMKIKAAAATDPSVKAAHFKAMTIGAIAEQKEYAAAAAAVEVYLLATGTTGFLSKVPKDMFNELADTKV